MTDSMESTGKTQRKAYGRCLTVLAKLERIIRDAGEVILSKHSALKVTAKEGHANFVTDMDVSIQQFLLGRLQELCPGSAFISEEKENSPLTDADTWIIDPVDGTSNLIHDLRLSAISVALFRDRAPLLACIYNPFTDEMFTAERGKGAFLNGSPIHVSDRPMGQALVGFGTSPYYHPKYQEITLDIAAEFLRCAVDIRRLGSAALDLAYIACGRFDVFYELHLKPWDVAAGSLLIQEAGGIFNMPALPRIDYSHSAAILASNRVCYDEAKAVIAAKIRDLP